MKILNMDGTVSGEQNDPRDAAIVPRKIWSSGMFEQADGIHATYTLPDGKTTGHYLIPRAALQALFEKADANFKRPAKTTSINNPNVLNNS